MGLLLVLASAASAQEVLVIGAVTDADLTTTLGRHDMKFAQFDEARTIYRQRAVGTGAAPSSGRK